jgi:MinD superfamily P-loop ATPase
VRVRVCLASGKGGTGKTLLATNLAAHLARRSGSVTYVDADVEEPNGFLFLRPEVEREERITVPVPALRTGACSGCGECRRLCAYGAILALEDRVMVFPELCHACGGCVFVCPENALEEVPREIGSVRYGRSGALTCLGGRLDVGEARAVPLIDRLLERAPTDGTCIVDAPPGTSCGVVAALHGADLLVLVTEPTPFGLHDLRLSVELGRTLGLRMVAVINRCDLGDDAARGYLAGEGVPLVAEIPFRREIAETYASGGLCLDRSPEVLCAVEALGEEVSRAG